MSTLSRFQLPPPRDWQAFEDMCRDLWSRLWKDPDTQKNGRTGQPQHGVDVYGRPERQNEWGGVQCKGKENLTNQILTLKELNEEVRKASNFTPSISAFVIATTGPKDVTVEQEAREITQRHIAEGRFSVTVLGWEDILNLLSDHPEVAEKHFSKFYRTTAAVKKISSDIEEITNQVNDLTTEMRAININTQTLLGSTTSLASDAIQQELHAELNYARDLLDQLKSSEALVYLEQLKNRVWGNAQSAARFRILTNIGVGELQLGRNQAAASKFFEALAYNPEDEKGQLNAALAHIIIGQRQQANELCAKVISSNPLCARAYALRIQSEPDKPLSEEDIQSIPVSVRKDPEVAWAIAESYRRTGNLDEAVRWLDDGLRTNAKPEPVLLASLSETLLAKVMNAPAVGTLGYVSPENRALLLRAVDLLTRVWNMLSDPAMRESRLSWKVNRGLAHRLLGDTERAWSDFSECLELRPKDPDLLRNISLLAIQTGEKAKALQYLEAIPAEKLTSDLCVLKADVLIDLQMHPQACSTIEQALKMELDPKLRQDAVRIYVRTLVQQNRHTEAQSFIEELRRSAPSDILLLVLAAFVARSSNDTERAISQAREAFQYINSETPLPILLISGHEFFLNRLFEEAAATFEKAKVSCFQINYAKLLLKCYYHAGMYGMALELCKEIRASGTYESELVELESSIFEEIGDLPNAARVCNEYLSSRTDFRIALRLALINFRSDHVTEVDQFLSSLRDHDFGALTPKVARLFARRKRFPEAARIMYEYRRNNFHNKNAHIEYVTYWFGDGRNDTSTPHPIAGTVAPDHAVHLESLDQKAWYIVENRTDAKLERYETTSDSPLGQKLLGQPIGSEVVLSENPYSSRKARILEIKHKYIYALHESLELIETVFQDSSTIVRVDLGKQVEGQLPEGLAKLLDQAGERQESHQKLEQLYVAGKISIGMLAKLSSASPIEMWAYLVAAPHLGIRCALGNFEERTTAQSILSSGKSTLVVDLTSVLTICGLDATDVLNSSNYSFGTPQSTIDELRKLLAREETISATGCMNIGKEGASYTRRIISPEQIAKNRELLQSALNWINRHCQVIPCTAALSMSANKKEEYDEALGTPFSDAILIAAQENHFLLSDDVTLRRFAEASYRTKGVWTQAVLTDALTKSLTNKGRWAVLSAKLAGSNYYHTAIDADVLLAAAAENEWRPGQLFKAVARHLSGMNCDQTSAIGVASNFVFRVWHEPLLTETKDLFLISIIDSIVLGRARKLVLGSFRNALAERFFLLPIDEHRILSVVDNWEKIHLV